MNYEISCRAQAIIDDIIRYAVVNFGDDQAADCVGGLYNSFDLLSDNPRTGWAWKGGHRLFVYRSHYVLYRILPGRVFITDIRNTRQDIPPEWEAM